MSLQKVSYPGPGCVVEFMHGNTPTLAFVLEEQKGKLRLITQNLRESTLASSRLLPWAGPMRGVNLSKQAITTLLEEHKQLRQKLAEEVDALAVWELAQSEVEKASSAWLASLVWENPTIDHEAALGSVLLAHKTHFRFSPPDFEILTAEKVALRIQEAEMVKIREALAAQGTVFFQQLWDAYQKNAYGVTHSFSPELAEKLQGILFSRMANPDSSEEESLWKMLTKGLPEHPHMALCLATAWGIVPPHYNDWLDQAGFVAGDAWAHSYEEDVLAVTKKYESIVNDSSLCLEDKGIFLQQPCFISMDPAGGNDRDDAFFIEQDAQGNMVLHVALACPACYWDFGSALDKAVLRRATSLYLPEGDEHMLAPDFGWKLFSLSENERRPSLVCSISFDAQYIPQHTTFHFGTLKAAKNLTLEEGQDVLKRVKQTPLSNKGSQLPKEGEPNWEELFAGEALAEESEPLPPLPDTHPALPYKEILENALTLAKHLQEKRISTGAVITERPDPVITLSSGSQGIAVSIENGVDTPLAQLVVGEFMILANQLVAEWSIEHQVPLLFRTQDVGIPKEYAGVWSQPHEISRIIKSLPGASLDLQPRKHAGLGLQAYSSFTSPIRRYVDLFNQGQVLQYLLSGKVCFSQEDLAAVFPLISARLDEVSSVQRMRPRYWKLVYFRQQGDKKWWSGVITEEGPAFVSVSLPWAQLFLRGKRSLFDEKITLGQQILLRIGKVNPLLNEIHILETQEE